MSAYVTTKMLKNSAAYLGMALWGARDVFIHPVTDALSANRAAEHLEALSETMTNAGEPGAGFAGDVLRGMAHAIRTSFSERPA